jgi:hypothetical protein
MFSAPGAPGVTAGEAAPDFDGTTTPDSKITSPAAASRGEVSGFKSFTYDWVSTEEKGSERTGNSDESVFSGQTGGGTRTPNSDSMLTCNDFLRRIWHIIETGSSNVWSCGF